MGIENNIEKPIEYFLDEINKIEKIFNEYIHVVQQKKATEINYKIQQSEWYVRGSIYHCKNLIKHYKKIGEELGGRVLSIVNSSGKPPEVIIMYSPEIQYLQYEFYSLVSLVRISLDDLRILLSPIFRTPYEQLPKSITGFMKGETNCPIYQNLVQSDVMKYLIDIRDCIVHFRSFATSDNVMAIIEGFETSQIDWPKSLAKISYRYSGNSKVVGNIYLPDTIFKYNQAGNKQLDSFTYAKKINIISQSVEFVKLCISNTVDSISLIEKVDQPIFTYNRAHKN